MVRKISRCVIACGCWRRSRARCITRTSAGWPNIHDEDLSEETWSPQEWSPDTRWRITITKSGKGRLWREPATDLSLDEMRARTALITGHRMNAQGVEEPLPAAEMQKIQSQRH